MVATTIIFASLLIAFCLYQKTFPVNRLNYSRIHNGMPITEVEQLLGTHAFRCHPKHRPDVPSDGEAVETMGWVGEDTCIAVNVNASGCVCGSSIENGDRRTFFERWRGWFADFFK